MTHATRRLKRWPRRPEAIVPLAALLLSCCTGCPFSVPSATGDGDVSNLDSGDNSTLQSASALDFNSTGLVTFTGSISGGFDTDLYDLGSLSPGDRVVADVQRNTGNLDAVAAIFNDAEQLVAFNDDRADDGSILDPLVDFVVRGDQGHYFLGIVSYPDSNTAGQYEITVSIVRNAGIPAPQSQIVFLDWVGGNDILVPNVGSYDLAPFSAADVGLPADQTAAVKTRVQAIVQSRYAGYNLIVLNSDDNAKPAAAHSTVYFGGNDRRAFAISEKIDPYNADHADDTIIFTESFRGAFRHTPTFGEMSQALGNTTAHEIGHLLGLVHTSDCSSLMDTGCSNDRLLSVQEFKAAQLDSSVFSLGYQDAPTLLGWILGLVGL